MTQLTLGTLIGQNPSNGKDVYAITLLVPSSEIKDLVISQLKFAKIDKYISEDRVSDPEYKALGDDNTIPGLSVNYRNGITTTSSEILDPSTWTLSITVSTNPGANYFLGNIYDIRNILSHEKTHLDDAMKALEKGKVINYEDRELFNAELELHAISTQILEDSYLKSSEAHKMAVEAYKIKNEDIKKRKATEKKKDNE